VDFLAVPFLYHLYGDHEREIGGIKFLLFGS
jgi:hypothetical protein